MSISPCILTPACDEKRVIYEASIADRAIANILIRFLSFISFFDFGYRLLTSLLLLMGHRDELLFSLLIGLSNDHAADRKNHYILLLRRALREAPADARKMVPPIMSKLISGDVRACVTYLKLADYFFRRCSQFRQSFIEALPSCLSQISKLTWSSNSLALPVHFEFVRMIMTWKQSYGHVYRLLEFCSSRAIRIIQTSNNLWSDPNHIVSSNNYFELQKVLRVFYEMDLRLIFIEMNLKESSAVLDLIIPKQFISGYTLDSESRMFTPDLHDEVNWRTFKNVNIIVKQCIKETEENAILHQLLRGCYKLAKKYQDILLRWLTTLNLTNLFEIIESQFDNPRLLFTQLNQERSRQISKVNGLNEELKRIVSMCQELINCVDIIDSDDEMNMIEVPFIDMSTNSSSKRNLI